PGPGAVAAQPRAGLGQRDQPLALRDDAAAGALGADRRRRPRLRARAAALAAGRLELNGDGGLDAAQRVLEREPHLDLEVAPASAPLLLLLAAASEEAAEEVAQVGEVEPLRVEAEATGPGPGAVLAAEAVVLLALLRVREHVVGVLDLLEALLRLGVARVRVRMVLPGELAVGLLDLVLARALRDAERPVEVLNGRHRPPPAWPRRRRARDARRGRRAGSPSARP